MAKFEIGIDDLPLTLESTEKIYNALTEAGFNVWAVSYDIEEEYHG